MDKKTTFIEVPLSQETSTAPKNSWLRAWVFSCEYCEIFKNSYFEEHLQTAAFALRKSR